MMNQFAQLLSTEKQTPVLLDTCIAINALQKKPDALVFRDKVTKRRDLRFIVPRMLVTEVAKVAKISQEDALATVESFSEMGQIDYVDDGDGSISRDADALMEKYPRYCHFPDNHYFIYCREQGALLVTYDNNLRMVAKMEGIMACTPGRFRIYQ
jgi:hypothetical protein